MSYCKAPDDNRTVVPKARQSIHRVILDWMAKQPRGTLLDAPAGYGHLSMNLKEMGFDVVCGEIEPEIFQVPDLECVYTDLNQRIEAADGSFDYVCCVDGLEHMTNPYQAVAEFARVLKPGGMGIFSIPNYSNIENRFKYFTKGYLERPKSLADYHGAGGNLFNFHNSPLTITLLELIFSINGLRLQNVMRDRIKRKQYFFLPLVWMFRLAALLSSENSCRKHRYDLTLKQEVVLGGNTMILITRKKVAKGGADG